MSKLTSNQISVGNVVIARAGWTGYVTEIETVENDFIENATNKTIKRTMEVLTGYITSGEKNGSPFRCPLYMIGRQFEQIGIYRINQEGEIISAFKAIEKLSSEEVKYIVPINKDGKCAVAHGKPLKKMGGYGGRENGILYAAINEQLIDKINELVETVNKLNGVYDDEC